jgi:hypothetical protein
VGDGPTASLSFQGTSATWPPPRACPKRRSVAPIRPGSRPSASWLAVRGDQRRPDDPAKKLDSELLPLDVRRNTSLQYLHYFT